MFGKKIVFGIIVLIFAVSAILFSVNDFHYSKALVRKVAHNEMIKAMGREMKKVVYWVATKYNPAGDNLPDEVDDVILGEIKDKLK